jgi:lysophospholipase L1-like esterase
MAYGTSITHGFDAEGPHLSYIAQTAWHLGADLINLGVGGSAHCEPELADYMATRDDWDVATLALSVNMQGFALDRFYERVSYMVSTVAERNPDKPVACITLFPYFRDFGIHDPGTNYGGTPEQYRQALRDAVAASSSGNVHLIEGGEILTEPRGLTHDLIHPGDHGMIEMGRNLAARLASLIAGCGRA